MMMTGPLLVRGGFRIPRRRGAPTYDFKIFSKKLHEIEKILGRGGSGPPGTLPLGSATASMDTKIGSPTFYTGALTAKTQTFTSVFRVLLVILKQQCLLTMCMCSRGIVAIIDRQVVVFLFEEYTTRFLLDCKVHLDLDVRQSTLNKKATFFVEYFNITLHVHYYPLAL